MGAAAELGRLALTPVHDGDIIAPAHQLGGDPAPDEPRAAKNEHPHASHRTAPLRPRKPFSQQRTPQACEGTVPLAASAPLTGSGIQ